MILKNSIIVITLSFSSPLLAMFLPGDRFLSTSRYHANNYLSKTLATLAADGNTYAKEPEDNNAPLESRLVLNKYWKSLKNKSPEEKNAALQKISNLNFTDQGWKFERYHLAAAILIGADITNPKLRSNPLKNAAIKQDAPLLNLYLTHGANANTQDNTGFPVLKYIQKASIAQLFLDRGAIITPLILEWATKKDYSTKLLALYADYGADLTYHNKSSCNILHDLGYEASNYYDNSAKLLKKASIIFGNLSKQEAYTLLTMRDHSNRLPEERISTSEVNESTIALKKLYKGKREVLEALFKDK